MSQVTYESVRVRCGNAIERLGDNYSNLIHITSDGNDYTHKHRDRHFDVGIAEANLINVASGFSLKGMPVVVNGITSFVLYNAFLQIRNDICYHNLDVTILGIGSGLSYGHLGFSHHSLEDIALLNTLPNMKIYLPADANEAEAALCDAVKRGGPAFIRVRSGSEPIIYDQHSLGSISFDSPDLVKEGKDILLLSYGATLYSSLMAAEALEKQGISTGVLNARSLKIYKLDKLKHYLQMFKGAIIIDEHYVDTGVGSIIINSLYDKIEIPIVKLGLPMEFIKIGGTPDELMKYYHLDTLSIIEEARKLYMRVSPYGN